MQQNIKTLLENNNFRNNQNYIFGNKLKNKIYSINKILKNQTKFIIFSFFGSVFFSYYIFLNILDYNEAINIILFMTIIILSIAFCTQIIPILYRYFIAFLKVNYFILSINNSSYNKIIKTYKKKGGDFKKILNNNFIIIKK
ncbi:MAG: hypothetical protein Q9M94_03200 [Candidatus Gracilibacteria bacterium]|nr:hypothetical protein [Candidatus Gracilibacteria bacterium]